MQNGNIAVLFLNLDKSGSKKVKINVKELGFHGNVKVLDVLMNTDLGIYKNKISKDLKTNECMFMELSQK